MPKERKRRDCSGFTRVHTPFTVVVSYTVFVVSYTVDLAGFISCSTFFGEFALSLPSVPSFPGPLSDCALENVASVLLRPGTSRLGERLL